MLIILLGRNCDGNIFYYFHMNALMLTKLISIANTLELCLFFIELSVCHKQQVLMHGHQGWNVRHGLCHIYMRYVYIYIWVVYSLCFFCCLFITVTWWYVWCIEWASGNQEEVQACLVTLWLFIISCYSLYKTTLGLLCSWFWYVFKISQIWIFFYWCHRNLVTRWKLWFIWVVKLCICWET